MFWRSYRPEHTKTQRLERFDSTPVLIPSNWPTEPLTIGVFSLITRRSSVAGCYSGTAMDSQDTLEFSRLAGVHPMIEKYPLERMAEDYEQMHSGKVRFRVVLTFGA